MWRQPRIASLLNDVLIGLPEFEGFKGSDLLSNDSLLAAVYPEIRRLALRLLRSERPSHTLQPTLLAHEAILRLVNAETSHFENRAHFYALASRTMRRILIDHARSKIAARRGTISTDKIETASDPDLTVLEVDEALSELAKVDQRAAKVVEMRFFAGLTEDEVGEILGISQQTIERDWHFAKAWLYNFVNRDPG